MNVLLDSNICLSTLFSCIRYLFIVFLLLFFRSYFRIRYRRWHMRRRLRSAKQNRTKGLITHYYHVRKALVRPIASCPDPPASTVYSSSGSNSVNLVGFLKLVEQLLICGNVEFHDFTLGLLVICAKFGAMLKLRNVWFSVHCHVLNFDVQVEFTLFIPKTRVRIVHV